MFDDFIEPRIRIVAIFLIVTFCISTPQSSILFYYEKEFSDIRIEKENIF